MTQSPHITPQEADTLAKLYLECRLTRLEEAELEYILTQCPYDSPAIRQVRATMVPMLLLANTAHTARKTSALRRSIVRIASIAASIAIIACAGGYWFQTYSDTKSNAPTIEVYVNGTMLSPHNAEIYARQVEAKCMELLSQTKQASKELQHQTISNMNNILNAQ